MLKQILFISSVVAVCLSAYASESVKMRPGLTTAPADAQESGQLCAIYVSGDKEHHDCYKADASFGEAQLFSDGMPGQQWRLMKPDVSEEAKADYERLSSVVEKFAGKFYLRNFGYLTVQDGQDNRYFSVMVKLSHFSKGAYTVYFYGDIATDSSGYKSVKVQYWTAPVSEPSQCGSGRECSSAKKDPAFVGHEDEVAQAVEMYLDYWLNSNVTI